MDIGGQALIGGVMIRSKEKVAIALRKKENKPMAEVLEIFMKKHYKFNNDMST